MKIMRLLTLLFLVSLSYACDKDFSFEQGSESAAEDPDGVFKQMVLGVGPWVRCDNQITQDGFQVSMETSFNFTARGQVTISETAYAFGNCKSKVDLPRRLLGVYTIERERQRDKVLIDMHFEGSQAEGTPDRTIFQILRIEGNNLYLGLIDSQRTGLTAADRPSAWDLRPFKRRE